MAGIYVKCSQLNSCVCCVVIYAIISLFFIVDDVLLFFFFYLNQFLVTRIIVPMEELALWLRKREFVTAQRSTKESNVRMVGKSYC